MAESIMPGVPGVGNHLPSRGGQRGESSGPRHTSTVLRYRLAKSSATRLWINGIVVPFVGDREVRCRDDINKGPTVAIFKINSPCEPAPDSSQRGNVVSFEVESPAAWSS